jgi:hypothetical protein
MSDYDRHNLEARRLYLREYMRKWRKENADKQREIQRRSNAKCRMREMSCACDGDGFEFDDTNLLPETPRQSRMWAELLAAAR